MAGPWLRPQATPAGAGREAPPPRDTYTAVQEQPMDRARGPVLPDHSLLLQIGNQALAV
jgi:hypothetical protein